MCFYKLFMCIFELDWNMYVCARILWATRQSVRNQIWSKSHQPIPRYKRAKLFSFFSHSSSFSRFVKFEGISAANLIEFGLEFSELHRCENYVLHLPVNILTVWRHSFLGCTTHYRISWCTVQLQKEALNHQKYYACINVSTASSHYSAVKKRQRSDLHKTAKKVCSPKKVWVKKMWNQRWWLKYGCGGRLMATITFQVNLVPRGAHNSPESSLFFH